MLRKILNTENFAIILQLVYYNIFECIIKQLLDVALHAIRNYSDLVKNTRLCKKSPLNLLPNFWFIRFTEDDYKVLMVS